MKVKQKSFATHLTDRQRLQRAMPVRVNSPSGKVNKNTAEIHSDIIILLLNQQNLCLDNRPKVDIVYAECCVESGIYYIL